MKKLLFLLFALFALFSCKKEQGDDYSPKSYEDGVFSFDYNGEHYHQYYHSVGSLRGCTAYAVYHPNMDSLAIIGHVGKFDNNQYRESYMQSVLFIVPLEGLSHSKVSLSSDKVIANVGTVDYRANEILSATLSFDELLDGNEYIEGHFSIKFTDVNNSTHSINNGLFKMWAMKYSGYLNRPEGVYSFPYTTGQLK